MTYLHLLTPVICVTIPYNLGFRVCLCMELRKSTPIRPTNAACQGSNSPLLGVCVPFLRSAGKYHSESGTDIFETSVPLHLMLAKWNSVTWNNYTLIHDTEFLGDSFTQGGRHKTRLEESAFRGAS